jgi:putative tributyrin esterase
MAYLQCNFYSEVLGRNTAMDVILPVAKTPDRLHPTLTLLHGLNGDNTSWIRNTSIERYVEELDLAVIMPDVGRSFYTDMAEGGRYFTFVSEELPAVARAMFHLSSAREDNFVAGLSMGGYGAFRLALTYPGRYAAAASLSGALDMASETPGSDDEWLQEKRRIFGELQAIRGSCNDLFALADKMVAGAGSQPRFFQWCGTEDFLYQANLRFRRHALGLGLNLDYSEGPGDHLWPYWDEQIRVVLRWLNPPKI